MKLKKLASLALAGALTLGLMPGMTMTALADGDTSSYTLTIPSTLNVANAGWNATDGISATGTLASGKKLTVTASSANSFKLKSGNNEVGYTLTTAEGGSQTTSWEFTTLDGAAQGLGIVVEDYSSKPAGTYQDTVTFTAKVENAGPTLADALKDGAKIKFEYQYNGRYSTYFEFTNNNGSYTLSSLKEEFNTTNLRVKADNPNVLILDVVCVVGNSRRDSFCSTIEFDTTDNTFKFTNRGATSTNPPRKCELISVSVNGTDVTNKLTDISQDNKPPAW